MPRIIHRRNDRGGPVGAPGANAAEFRARLEADFVYQILGDSKDDEKLYIEDAITGEKVKKHYCIKVFTDIVNNKFGYTTYANRCPVGLHDKFGEIFAVSPQVFIDAGMSESFENGYFWTPKNFSNEYNDYRKFSNNVIIKTEKDSFTFGENSRTFLLTENKKYTFGVELEFSKLCIQDYLTFKYNMKCVKDGSLNKKTNPGAGGPEIVTGVLKGDEGIRHLQEICKELSKRGTINHECGIHVHIGGFEPTNKFITLAYILGCKLEKEILSTLPQSRRANEYCRTIRNKKLSLDFLNEGKVSKIELDNFYLNLYEWLAHNPIKLINKKSKTGLKYNRHSQHPMGAKCSYDHNTPRYCWLNMIPTAFDTRGDNSHTIEFRCHSGSSNFIKIFNWIKICMAFVHYVENHQKEILGNKVIYLYDVIQAAYPKGYKKLNEYIEDRIVRFADDPNAEIKEYSEKDKEKVNTIKELLCAS